MEWNDLCLANCYFAHDSSGFPILLLFFDAQSGRSCYPLDRHAGPVARTWWRPFRQPAKDAARKIAFAEDGAVFEGYTAAGIAGIRKGTSNPTLTLPANVREYPEAIAQALSRLRLVGINGPYSEDSEAAVARPRRRRSRNV
jgi:hypothetical protein